MHVANGQDKCAEKVVGGNSLSQALRPKEAMTLHVLVHAERATTSARSPAMREVANQDETKAQGCVGKWFAGDGRQPTGKLVLKQPIKIKRQRITFEGDDSVRRLLRCTL